MDVKRFFLKNNLEVIDKRPQGGCLWVVGTEREIYSIVNKACRMFGIDGYYSVTGGKASGHRPAWFTTWSK